MATLRSSVVDATPQFVTGTFDAKDVRLATMLNMQRGLFSSTDFAVTEKSVPNMSVDIAPGRCLLDPGNSTFQGLYTAVRATSYNTATDGAITWTAADATNPRIDLLCIEVRDTAEDASGATGWGFRVETGTANASATHQLETAYWPTIPTGVVPIAAIHIPAADTAINTASITNLKPMGGYRGVCAGPNGAAGESTASTTYVRLTTPDFLFVYVPHAAAQIRFGMFGQWKISVASGNQFVTLFLNGTQIKSATAGGAPAVLEGHGATIQGTANTYRHLTTYGLSWTSDFSGAADVSDVATGMTFSGTGSTATANMGIIGLPAGWYVVEQRYKTTANTLTARNRYLWAEVVG